MDLPNQGSPGVTRFIPGLGLIEGFSPALLRTEFVVAATVFAVLVPSAVAYGDLAGVTPVAGPNAAVEQLGLPFGLEFETEIIYIAEQFE